MGMFNYVQCEMPLPGMTEDDKPIEFQTKSLGDLNMDTYFISADGKLEMDEYQFGATGRWYLIDTEKSLLDDRGTLWFTEEEAEAEGFVEVDTWRMLQKGEDTTYIPTREYVRKFIGRVPVNFTGEFNFYGGDHNRRGTWYEYVATVENGKVTNIKRDTEQELKWLKIHDRFKVHGEV